MIFLTYCLFEIFFFRAHCLHSATLRLLHFLLPPYMSKSQEDYKIQLCFLSMLVCPILDGCCVCVAFKALFVYMKCFDFCCLWSAGFCPWDCHCFKGTFCPTPQPRLFSGRESTLPLWTFSGLCLYCLIHWE